MVTAEIVLAITMGLESVRSLVEVSFGIILTV